MTDRYVLDNRKAVPCPDLMTWARWFEKADRIVAKDQIGDVKVSTVFLGLDHSFGDGAPLLFETMAFGGPYDETQARCTTWEEAEAQHAAMCALVRGCSMTAESPDTARAGSSDASLSSEQHAPRAVEHHDAGALGMKRGPYLTDAQARHFASVPAEGFVVKSERARKPLAALEALGFVSLDWYVQPDALRGRHQLKARVSLAERGRSLLASIATGATK